ncbi:MAG: undecaprenyl-diphosphate phosphatase [Promethearchaeota archaeon]
MLEYLIIAILQGLFEWLPISSSGQTMIIATNFFGISPENAFSLAIWLHLGTTLAVILKFREEFVNILKSITQNATNLNGFATKKRNWIVYATLGTGITAIPLYLVFRMIFLNIFTAIQGDIITLVVSGFLIITGIFILKTRKIQSNITLAMLSNDKVRKDSFISGLVQGFSILPGISRSGVTIGGILLKKYDQDEALKLSFLMSVPVAFASILVDLIFGEGLIFGVLDLLTIVITTLVSFITGYLTIEFLLRIAQKTSFGYFCILYGVIAYIIIIPFILIP